MLARGALCRLGVSTTSARALPQLARALQRTLGSRNASTLAAVRALWCAHTCALGARRSYATTTSATKPTATVKKAVKASAAKKTSPKKRAPKTAAQKTTKKPKTATKAKAKPKAKKAPKKAAPKKRVPKVLTPEQEEKAKVRQERAHVKKEKARITQLRKTALREPHAPSPVSAYTAFVIEQTAGKQDGSNGSGRLADVAKRWKSLTPAEHEHYNHVAREKTAARQADYHAWVLSHTPQEVNAANNARQQLRRLLKNVGKRRYPPHTAKIVDDRQPKRPRTPFILFTVERWATGDLKNIKTSEAAKLISEEWKALSAGEKKKYEEEFAANRERYARETASTS